MNAFDRAFAATLGHEGVLSTDRSDPGNYRPDGSFHGTKYGISARAYPNIDIAALTLAEAKAIYRRDFWERPRLDKLQADVAIQVFDGAVNSGPRVSIMWLQRALHVTADGVIGPVTTAKVRADPRTTTPPVRAVRKATSPGLVAGVRQAQAARAQPVLRSPGESQALAAAAVPQTLPAQPTRAETVASPRVAVAVAVRSTAPAARAATAATATPASSRSSEA